MTQTVKEVVDALGGRVAVASLLNITPQGVSMACGRNIIPAPWHMRIYKLAKRKGVRIAPELLEVKRT